MSTEIIRNEDGTVLFPADLMEVVEHVSSLVSTDPVVQQFIDQQDPDTRDAFAWRAMILALATAQLS
jgi:hypothetical protein